jgi:hypothetical protein
MNYDGRTVKKVYEKEREEEVYPAKMRGIPSKMGSAK